LVTDRRIWSKLGLSKAILLANQTILSINNQSSHASNIESFSFNNVTLREVWSSFFKIKSKARGADGLSINILNPALNQIFPAFTRIINGCIISSSFPSLWKETIVCQIPKIKNPVSISDRRPISIIVPIAKTCEHILNSQIDRFIEKHKLLTPYQSGFRKKKHSTATALIDVTDTLRQAIDIKNVCIVVLLNFSSAFNLVNFDILLAKLKNQFHFS
jgi:hypothetical protein